MLRRTPNNKKTAKPRNYRRPSKSEISKWFAQLHKLGECDLFPEGRNQPMLHTEREKRRFFKLADQLCEASAPDKRKKIKTALARIAFGE
jgi:hypothetical protein